MSAASSTYAADNPVRFRGHPFGGLVREDRFGHLAGFDAAATPDKAPAEDTSPAIEDAGGFDFHLGVYSRF
jgi:hypothetical protein